MASTIGVVGGMGPDATNTLCVLLTAATPARSDAEHIPVISFNNPAIPSRVDGMAGGPSPAPEMIRTAATLERAGADFLVVPCNLAHVWLSEIRDAVGIPVLDMVEETAAFVEREHAAVGRVGILASTPTLECGLHRRALARAGRELLEPEPGAQARVMEAIYGPDGIKAGRRERPRALLAGVAAGLVERGAEVILAACTEVSVVLTGDLAVPLVDPLRILAQAAVARARSGPARTQRRTSWAES